uniref:Uncharacterized protein n=1 Tax=Romanomermis culicivorax TaxID=13658 RepID=A0A915K6G7_ROMCU
METKEVMNRSNHTLMDIPQETTTIVQTSMDVVWPAVDPSIYLATPVVLTSPPMIATLAAARCILPVHFSQQFILDSQSTALATALKAYGFPPLPPHVLFAQHHW